MVSNKGFIRIVEMVIAIVIILTMLVVAYKRNASEQNTQDLSEVARDILRDIASQEQLRNEVLNAQANVNSMPNTILFINNSLPDYLLFELRACVASSACGQSQYRGNVYSAERIISVSSGVTSFSPIKLRLFIWVSE